MTEENKSEIAQKEEQILKFWQDNKIFEKSLKNPPAGGASKGTFTFYDGPPFATGTPHYGHLLAGTMKDVIPRYKTMRGYYVRRRWGWDCHGLPLENLVEKELGLKSKKDIIDYGVENFNAKARAGVLRYADEWKKIVPRLGRFVDMEDDYRTMDASYSETIWWIFKTLHDKGLIYEGYKSMHICPRCETTLSNFEVTQGYKDVTDISVTVKFKLKNPEKIGLTGDVYILAWTTTPWTLPGNVALAVGPKVDYVVITKVTESASYGKEYKIPDQVEKFIIAKKVFEKEENKLVPRKDKSKRYYFGSDNGIYDEIKELKGDDLINLEYEPVFDYYTNDQKLEHRENGWKIYGADFVTIEDGTGVVHIAPAFGDDDLTLGREKNLPFIQHVAMNGTFKAEVKDWPGLPVKSIDDPQATDVLILRNLAERNLLFAKEKFTHSYPHCWRCETPLLNYAASSWFVKVTDFKDKLVAENQKINWIPEHLRDGRFGKWLEGARDWAISRSRFWGAPLPVWRCSACGVDKVFGSFSDLSKEMGVSGNKYWAMRHGEAEKNVSDLISDKPTDPNHLTNKGRKEVEASAQKLKNEKIDLVISSDFVRAKETAKIVAEKLGLKDEQIIFDERLREADTGDFTGSTWTEYNEAFGGGESRLREHLPTGGENYTDIRRRVMSCLFEIDKEYQDKNILLISHGLPLYMLQASLDHLSYQEITKASKGTTDFATGELRPLNFAYYPHNRDYELDVHRPFIDEVEFACACGGSFKRVPDVFDCWFESGSMPIAQDHYPFNKDEVDPLVGRNFPADFIAEGLDQTRGWFYSLLVLSVALFDHRPYKNVITNGLVLAEDGQKMSKSLQNYPDPMTVVDKYGADALRLYLMNSPAVHGEDLNFSEKGVIEIGRKIIGRLLNVLAFYQIYAGPNREVELLGSLSRFNLPVLNVLDQWILVRLNETIEAVSWSLDKYEIDRAIWPLDSFVDDLSTWYLRRSRDRFKEESDDKQSAIVTTKYVLQELAKLLAPLAPFASEMIWQGLGLDKEVESVHLSVWPEIVKLSLTETEQEQVLTKMAEARQIVSLGMEFRQQIKVKVRQPLAEAKIKSTGLKDDVAYQELIKDELNVKKLSFGEALDCEVWLDGRITVELQAEGTIRELARQVQDERKRFNLNPADKIELIIEADEKGEKILRQFETEFKTNVGCEKISYAKVEGEAEIFAGGLSFKVKIVKL